MEFSYLFVAKYKANTEADLESEGGKTTTEMDRIIPHRELPPIPNDYLKHSL